MKAFLLAAGLGTRLKPFTNTNPKCLLPINGVTLLERTILYLKQYGISEFVINIHHHGQKIKDFIAEKNTFGCQIYFSDESDELLETGGGLLKARPFLENDDFIMMNTDILTTLDLQKMIAFHQEKNALATLAVCDRESSRKLLFDDSLRLSGWMHKNTREVIESRFVENPKELAFSGIHIVSSKIFDLIEEEGKFSIIQPYLRLAKTEHLQGFDHTGRLLLDVGKPEAITKAEQFFK